VSKFNKICFETVKIHTPVTKSQEHLHWTFLTRSKHAIAWYSKKLSQIRLRKSSVSKRNHTYRVTGYRATPIPSLSPASVYRSLDSQDEQRTVRRNPSTARIMPRPSYFIQAGMYQISGSSWADIQPFSLSGSSSVSGRNSERHWISQPEY